MVRITGIEPARECPQEPKSCASASSAISAHKTMRIEHNAVIITQKPYNMYGFIW